MTHIYKKFSTYGDINKKMRQRASMMLKLCVLAASLYYLQQRLDGPSFLEVSSRLREDFNVFVLFFLLLVSLSVVNLSLDGLLWAAISRGGTRKRWLHYLKHHLISLSIGSVTPVSLGEYGGKIRQFAGKINKLKGLYLAYLFRVSKMMSKNFVGSIFLFLLIYLHSYQNWPIWVAYVISFLCALGVVGFLFIEKILPFFIKLPLFGRPYLKPIGRLLFSKKQKTLWLALGGIKFLTYSLQLALMLYFFSGRELNLAYLLLLSGFYYSVAAYIPSIQIVDPLIKASAGIMILHAAIPFDSAIAVSITLVWLVNVGIPSLGGLGLWMRKGERSA